MTLKKMMKPPTQPESDELGVGFRIGPNGEVEMMTPAETRAVMMQTTRDAMIATRWRRPRTLH